MQRAGNLKSAGGVGLEVGREGVASAAWLFACLTFSVLANFCSSEMAYLTLVLFSALLIVGKRVDPPPIRKTDLPIAFIAPLAAQVPSIPFAARSAPSATSSVFMVAAALAEELFYRGALLPDLGNAMQAFVFALCHMRLSDPVSLVSSALLVPHYFLLGFTLGLLAERGGWPISFAAHGVYNLLSLHYVLPFDVSTVTSLVLGDIAVTALTALYLRAAKTPTLQRMPCGCCREVKDGV